MSGSFPSSTFCAAVSGSLLGTAASSEVELPPGVSSVVPRPGVTGSVGSVCGLGASGIVCGLGPSGSGCCGALCCASPCPGCPSIMHTRAPANTLLLTTRISLTPARLPAPKALPATRLPARHPRRHPHKLTAHLLGRTFPASRSTNSPLRAPFFLKLSLNFVV